MTILDLFKTCKINLTDANISRDDAEMLTYEFEITPKEFLNFSKQDFKANDQRGNINALTNAKRAIDCQTDKILACFGFDIKELPKINNEYIIFINPQLYKTDLPHKLKLLQALDLAPAGIIADVRTIRNKLEHEYKQFSDKEVQNAIQLADLFINATDSKLKMVWAYRISDVDAVNSSQGGLIDVRFSEKDKKLSIGGFISGKHFKIELTKEDIEFYAFLKLTYSFHYDQDVEDYFKELIAIIKHPIPADQIHVENI